MSIESPPVRRPHTISESFQEHRLVTKFLPWILAAAFLLLYLATLNHWVTLNSLTPNHSVPLSSLNHVATLSGYNYQPDLTKPLFWLLTWPFRLLPTHLIPVALNLFSALCATLTLFLLARSVAILPHDRTEEQRLREKNPDGLLSIRSAWLPPAFAVILCGLQLTFWESATAISAEMLDLLIFAYLVRCVLEFRLDARQSWLTRASFIYAAGMANNWAMIAFFPAFLAALIWIKGLSFFNLRFLMRMFVLGVAGLAFYLLLPIHAAITSDYVSFWQAVKANLGEQKYYVSILLNPGIIFHHEQPQWILIFSSLLPLVVMGIRWPASFGDSSKLGIAISTFVFHLFHGVLFLFCTWIALDPSMSPRNHSVFAIYYGFAGLPLYYLGALGAGYFLGYFLLVFGVKPVGRPRPVAPLTPYINKTVLIGAWILVIAAPVLLFYKNLAQIRENNGPMLRQYASLLGSGLTPGAVALSDDPTKLFLVQADLYAGRHPTNIFLSTGGLPSPLQLPIYHTWLKQRHAQRWPLTPPKDFFQQVELVRLVYGLAQTNTVLYLHPSFGYYFEVLYPEPHGILNQLKPYPPDDLTAPRPGEPLLGSNLVFWANASKTAFPPVLAALPNTRPAGNIQLLDNALAALRVNKRPNQTAVILGSFYSRALTAWGVELQKSGKLPEAASAFSEALAMQPENLVAKWNLECNAKLQKGEKLDVEMTTAIQDKFGQYGSWERIMNINGPFDHPTICFEQGRVFADNRNYRQGAQLFHRVKELSPHNLPSRLALANIYLVSSMPDHTLREIAEITADPATFPPDRSIAPEILALQTGAFLIKTNPAAAEKAVTDALAKYPDDENLLAVATRRFINFGYYSNALPYIDRRLRIDPENPYILNDKGFAYLQLDMLAHAIPVLTRALNLQTNRETELYYLTLFNRASAYLKSNDFVAAHRDYDELYTKFPNHYAVNYGLGEIASRRRDFRTALNHYNIYLASAPTNTVEYTNVLAHIDQAKRNLQVQ